MNYRERVMQALNAKLMVATFDPIMNGATTWVNNPTLSRKLKHFSDLDPQQQPCLYQVEHDEEVTQKGGRNPERVTMEVSAVCYAYAGNDYDIGSTFINNMIAGIKNSLTIDDPQNNACTLGGLVYNCWVEGKIFKDPGDLDKQCLLVLPIKITLPSTPPGDA